MKLIWKALIALLCLQCLAACLRETPEQIRAKIYKGPLGEFLNFQQYSERLQSRCEVSEANDVSPTYRCNEQKLVARGYKQEEIMVFVQPLAYRKWPALQESRLGTIRHVEKKGASETGFHFHLPPALCSLYLGMNSSFYMKLAEGFDDEYVFYEWSCSKTEAAAFQSGRWLRDDGDFFLVQFERVEAVSLKTGDAFLLWSDTAAEGEEIGYGRDYDEPFKGTLLARKDSWAYNPDLMPEEFKLKEPWMDLLRPL